MQFKQKINKQGVKSVHVVCVKEFPDGTKCSQVGSKIDNNILDTLYQKVITLNTTMLREAHKTRDRQNGIEQLLGVKKRELEKVKKAIDNLHKNFEEEVISRQDFFERRAVRKRKN